MHRGKQFLAERYRRRRMRTAAAGRPLRDLTLERLEPRTVLTIASNLIPQGILAQLTGTSQSPVLQTAFAPGVSTLATASPGSKVGVQAAYYQFSVAGSQPSDTVSFSTQCSSKAVDLALAIYDADGNLIEVADADVPTSYAGTERLVATLDSARPYVLGVFARNDDPASAGGDPVTISVDTGKQRTNSTIKVDPMSGKVTFSAASGFDGLQGAGDVDYYPLKLTNLGQQSTVRLQPAAGSGVQLYGELYRRNDPREPWTQIASAAAAAAGGVVTLVPQAAPGVNLNDSEFLLAVASKGLQTPAQGYTVAIDGSQSLLVPATVSNAGTTDLGLCLPAIPGKAAATLSKTAALPSTYTVRATVSGPLRVTVDPSFLFKPVVGVYDSSGTHLLGVASRTSDGPVSLSIDAKAGQQYIVRVATLSNKPSSSFALTVSQSYAPTKLVANATVASTKSSVGLLNLNPAAGGSFLRILPEAGADILVLRLGAQPAATASPRLSILSPSSPQTPPFTLAPLAGQKTIDYAIDLSQMSGPFDLFVTGVGGVGTAELSYATATLPRSLSAAAFAPAAIDLQSGSFTTPSLQKTVAFGAMVSKAAFFELSPSANETISTVASGPAAVLEYVRTGDTFELKDWSMQTGGTPSISGVVPGKQVVGVASMSLALGGTTGLGIKVAGPKTRAGVGVAMVPDVKNPFQSILQIRDQFLQAPEQRDLWQTLLPANLKANNASQVTFTPASPLGSLRAKVTVLDAADKPLASGTSQAGKPLSLSLAPGLLKAGGSLRFLVEPLAGVPLGDGGYDLKLTVQTTDARPFELTESTFYPYANKAAIGKDFPYTTDAYGAPKDGVLPAFLTTQPISFGGVANGAITSSQNVYYTKPPVFAAIGNTDAIDVYSFSLPVDPVTKQPAATPFEIYTTEAAGSTLDTTIGLYIAKYKVVGNAVTSTIESYEQVDSIPASRDYYPTDRSTVDAKIVVNNPGHLYDQFTRVEGKKTVYADSKYTLFVMVKGQFGTTGSYTLHVAPIQPQRVGPRPAADPAAVALPDASTVIDPVSGLAAVAAGGDFGFNTPSTFDAGSAITATFHASGLQNYGSIFVDVYDANDHLLYTQSTVVSSLDVTVPLDSQANPFEPSSRYYLRMRQALGLNWTGTDLATDVSPGSPVPVANATYYLRDSSEPTPHRNLAPAPDGHASGTLDVSGSAPAQQSMTFYVEADGMATFTITTGAVSGGTWALYRLRSAGSNTEFDSIQRQLVDFVQVNGQGSHTFVDDLASGSYELLLTGTAAKNANAGSYDVHLPAFSATDIPLDPNTADNTSSPLGFSEPAFVRPLGAAITSQYLHVAAPADAAKGWSIDLDFMSPLAVTDDKLQAIQALDEAKNPKNTFSIYKRNAFAHAGQNADDYVAVDYDFSPGPVIGAVLDPVVGESVTRYVGFQLTVNDTPLPGDEYFIGHHSFLLGGQYLVGPRFSVPQSGDPDLVVAAIDLKPAGGQTFVDVEIRNEGYGSATDFAGTMQISNYASDGTVKAAFQSLGGHASTHFTFNWKPDDPSDFISMLVNQPNTIGELRVDNNSSTVTLSTVDKHKPTASIALANPSMDGEAGAVWGRYLSGVYNVPIDFNVTGGDVDNDYFSTIVSGVKYDTHEAVNGTKAPGYVSVFQQDAGDLDPTTPDHPNEIHYQVIDQYGLKTDEFVQRVDVVAKPSFWRDNTGPVIESGIVWDAAKHGYDIAINYNIVNYDKTVEDLLGPVPFIGDKKNIFRINVAGSGFASLDPTFVPSVPLTLTLLLRVVNEDIFNEQYSGTQPIGDHTTVTVAPLIDPRTVDVTGGTVSLQVRDYPIAHYDSPKVPVYSLGVKGLASFDINLGFSIDVKLDAGVKLGLQFKPDFKLGLMAPTFLKPSVTPSATISGDVEVLNLPLAGIEGSVGLRINVAAGLANLGYSEIVSFDDIFKPGVFGVGASFELVIGAKAKLAGATVWSTEYDIPLGPQDMGGVVTTDVGEAAGANALAKAFAIAFGGPADPLLQALALPSGVTGSPTPVVLGGQALVQDDGFEPAPQMIIDPQSGAGILVQTAQVDASDPGKKKGILQVAGRTGLGAWSDPLNLPSTDASNPVLSFTHDAAGKTPAVVVYEALTGYDSPSGRQLGDVLVRHDLKYRYYDGVTWGGEASLTPADGLYDSQASVAFNGQGRGVAAWVHNTSATPFAADGSYARNSQDVQAAVWNPATHAWSAPLTISKAADGIADIKPAAAVDGSGNAIVTWIRGDADANTLYFSRYDGKNWSAPSSVAVDGMPSGSYGEVALGVDDQGLVNLLFSHRVKNADGTLDSRLFDRATAFAAFGQSAGADQVSRTFAGYSHLRTTAGADGKLVAYWQQSDGVNDGVYAAALTRPVGNQRAAWSAPAKLTATRDITRLPTVAIDLDGKLQTLYVSNALPENRLLDINRPLPVSAPAVTAPMVPGVASVSYAPLPELSFSSPLSFDQSKSAVAGTTAIGHATVTNTGMAGDTVTINWFSGLPGGGTISAGGILLGSKTITLSPGSSYDIAAAFPVADGSQLYSVQVVGTKGEAISTSDDVTVATLEGLPDIVVESVLPSIAAVPGAPETITATVVNASDLPIDDFDVQFYAGDPQHPENPVTLIDTRHVVSLNAHAKTTLSFPVILPTERGTFTYTVRADAGNAVDEAIEGNNDGHFTGSFRADPAIAFDASGKARVSATLLDATGVNNVTVDVVVRNDGDVAITNLPVHLTAARNDGAAQAVGDRVIASLGPGQETTVTYTVSGLEGTYHYRASLDALAVAADDDPSNDTGTTSLVIHGLANLVVGQLALMVPPSVPSAPGPMQGWPLSLSATIANVGIADAKGVLVEVFAKGRDSNGNGFSILVGGTTITLDALSHTILALPIDTTQLAGNVTLVVRVNRFHAVLESNELDDTASLDVTFAPKIIPQVASLAVPAAGTYTQGATLEFTATFNEPVTVVGKPTIGIMVGQKARMATYVSGSGTSSLLFRMNVTGGDMAPYGIVLGGIAFPAGSSIRDAVGTPAVATLPGTNTSGIRIDALPPYVQAIVPPAVKTYGLAQALQFQLIFNEPVTVTGTPTITLKVGNRVRTAAYVGGSGTAILLFRYVVQSGDADNMGVVLGRSISLPSSATIRDAAANAAGLTLPLAQTTGVKVKG